ncbi:MULTISPECIES: HIRAN domain-containing protein [Candidatus Accumulibacter]|uniref:HIRAN domain protein n=1 Tax=Candidatus Accumulibacter cognatus TaxID=2954383 RepID=A0A080MDC3_9PROT|nr:MULTISPECIES: HIRAN domain-containing protein [Candidatus Accumulibacter]KFB75214.1 MAG: HIRAN domain protein [Candidatus Accumulibacter cognatus]MBL8401741.1 HIRAN domain-containing protein [Accumulibacter sp.]QLH50844.1 MAG: HIRAN domain-containing protein [Candidatus Accumulibacter cognatus]
MRFRQRISPLIWLVLCGSAGAAETIRVLVQSSPLAGSQYYAVAELWPQIKPGDHLILIREPDNRHDRKAIRVEWNGRPLGYVPRAENRAVAQAIDAGEKLEARVSRLRDDPNPWRRVEFEVFLVL